MLIPTLSFLFHLHSVHLQSPRLSPPTAELSIAKKLLNRITERQLPKFVGRTIKNRDDHKKPACDFVRSKGLEINESYLESKVIHYITVY